ncbi:hypothetical protein [Rhodococcus chondri]|uniref:Uncharacterized protein n=1 Tax=Rhodococcus chondri TaxID=3065941 RepID=A0ABU7JVD9_9NOCA|nr:hypothetical protein [Rhodococcus sp. CC-R104]MEE2033712.1 hypothetical protein [Rhodococcus sp. CC-R104]
MTTALMGSHLTVPAGVPADDARIAADTSMALISSHTLPTDQAAELLDSAGRALDTGVGITSASP